ncbi:MAG: hypothetical protein MUQ30_10405 [Anaerolineae bacterium]|nr:hypothetical protein [Anaerolineae bacterium]
MPEITAARPVAGQPIETAWGDQMHDAMEALPSTLRGFQVIAAPNTPGTSAVLPFAGATFISQPTVMVSAAVQDTSGMIVAGVSAITTTGFTCYIERSNGLNITTGTTIYWVAVGTLA